MKKVRDPALVRDFCQIPNVGKATAADFLRLGLTEPQQLGQQEAHHLYLQLCELSNCRHDPCVEDVFAAAIEFMQGKANLPWWHYSQLRLNKARQTPSE